MNSKILLAATLFLMSCGQATQEHTDTFMNQDITRFTTKEGVECIAYVSGNKAGVSCNWDKHNAQQGLRMPIKDIYHDFRLGFK